VTVTRCMLASAHMLCGNYERSVYFTITYHFIFKNVRRTQTIAAIACMTVEKIGCAKRLKLILIDNMACRKYNLIFTCHYHVITISHISGMKKNSGLH
jgi:hypothetical protein